ncbi:MAG: Ig-like domain-containing protein [Hyphomicrobiaceae bacterium]
MGTIRVEFVPIKKFNLGLLGLDHLQIVYEDETSVIDKQDYWYVLEGTHDGSLLEGQLGVLGEEIFTELAAANGANGDDLIASIGTPESRGSRVVYTGPDALSLWQTMMDYGKEIDAQQFPYEGLAWPFSPGAIMNSSSVVATLLYSVGIDINANMPFGIRNSPGTSTLLGTSGADEITLGGNFTQVAAGFGDDILRGTETLLWPEKFFGGLDDDTIMWSKGENIVHGGEARTPYALDGLDTIDYSGVGLVHIVSTKHAVEHKVADFVSAFDGGSDQLFSIEAITWNRETDIVTVGQGVDLLEKPIMLNLDDSAGGKGDELSFFDNTAPLLVNAIDADMISIQTIANQGLDAGYWAQSVEWLAGSSGDDRIYVGATLLGAEGGQGDDLLDGRLAPAFTSASPLGYDIELYGGDGNDTIVAGAGYTMAEGGAGADIFVVSTMGSGETEAYPELVITDAGAQDKLYIPYNYFQETRGEFEDSELMQLRGAPFKFYDMMPVSLFFWGIPDDNIVEGYIDFVGAIQYYMDGADLIISIMMGDVETFQQDYGPGEPPGPLTTVIAADGATETIVRVVDWEDGDLGITFPLTFDGATYNQTGFEDYPGFAEAVQNAVAPSAFIAPLELRPDAYVPQDIVASNPGPIALSAFSLFAADETPEATEGDDVISKPDGGPYEIYGLGGNDSISGSAGGDYIDGGPGNDTMAGERGNDAYVVDSAGDVIVEQAGGGFDHVYSSVDYALGSELEHLTLTGDAIFGTGNALRNTIVGNDRDNILSGGEGDDTLAGNGGDDILIGGNGGDGYVYEIGDGDDIVIELASDLGDDVLVFAGGILPEDLLFVRDPSALNDLIVRFVEGGSITVLDYFTAPGTIEGAEFASGLVWDFATFDGLAQAALISANTTPVAANDAYVYAGDTTFRLPVSALLENDTDADGDDLTVTAIWSVSEGAAILDGEDIIVTASASQAPRTVFSYIVSDGNGGSASATAEITFWPNSPPVITASALEPVNFDTPAQGVIVASDADGDSLFYAVADGAGPALGTVTIGENGGFTYTPFAGARGDESFTIRVTDPFDASADQTFSFTIESAGNNPPQITSVSMTEAWEDQISTGLLVATDPDGDPLSYAVKDGAGPSKGTVSIAADGSFTYTPHANLNGSETFTIIVTDSVGATAEQVVSFDIAPVNDAPLAVDDLGFSVEAGQNIAIAAAALLANDSDIEGDPLTIVSVSSATGGTAMLLTDGNVTFTADPNFDGQASFSYAISDGLETSASAIVIVDVTPPAVETGVTLTGTNCADRLVGTDLDDVIYGRKGNDILIGKGGNDIFGIQGNDGLDRFDGGSGYDIIQGSNGDDVLRVTSHLANLNSIEEIDGGAGRDAIVATSCKDVLDFSNITLKGIELIRLGGGNDIVRGSTGDDVFSGGAGQDTFIFGPGGGHDTIVDFNPGSISCGHHRGSKTAGTAHHDTIDLMSYDFDSYGAVRRLMHQRGHDVVIEFEQGSSLSLKNTQLAELKAWDFLI